MNHKLNILLLFISITTLFAQKKEPYTFGKISQDDYDLTIYSKDSTANAVFLDERGNTTFHESNNRIVIRTKYYAKIKIFNKEGENNATIEIPLYNSKDASEKVKKIKAQTHNGKIQIRLNDKNIYRKRINENWRQVSFTLPDVRENSIIEYEYTLESPFKFNFKGWEFQTKIPKLYSEFFALVPGNYVYNRSLVGSQKLHVNDSSIKKGCFSISGIPGEADCEKLTYAMKDIPAFIEEDYMTSKENYLSKIKFELSEFRGFDGVTDKFTKSWKDVDKEFKGEKSIGRQLRKINYLEKQLPLDLINGEPSLEKAKKVYNYIKNHFTWNGKYRVFNDVFVKDAFKDKVGNIMEINISLVNALNATGFDAELMLISTRRNGHPTKLHPVMTDFNYGIAKLNINGKSYLLDATNKQLPFNMLPFKVLNSYGRVMNFKKGSYWYDIEAKVKTRSSISLNLKLNKDGNFTGQMNITSTGYRGLNRRNELITEGKEAYLNAIENESQDLIVNSYANKNLDNFEKPFSELFDIEIESESDLTNNTILLNPFIVNKIIENPFKLKERTYPVDFGYTFFNMYTLQLEIPDGYKVKSLPEQKAIKLPDNAGMFIFNLTNKGNKISMISRVNIQKPIFTAFGYHYLKEFYNEIIKTHKSLITLEKK